MGFGCPVSEEIAAVGSCLWGWGGAVAAGLWGREDKQTITGRVFKSKGICSNSVGVRRKESQNMFHHARFIYTHRDWFLLSSKEITTSLAAMYIQVRVRTVELRL